MNSEIPSVQKVKDELNKYYCLNIQKVAYLGKSDNVTYCIHTKDENKFLLKLHMGSNSKNMIVSELLWLESLETNTILKVQRPIRNKNNELTTNIINENTGNSSYWTLQDWLEGETLKRQPTDMELEKLAHLMVTLHEHTVRWNVPGTFERPYYNDENLLYSLNQLKQLLYINVMSTDDYEIMKKTTDKILTIIKSQHLGCDTWGVIHSDLHESNYIFCQGQAFAIDFSSCGFGFYLFDIAETCLHLIPENRKKLITFYQKERNLQKNYPEVLEAFFLWAIIRNFAFLSINNDEHKELANAIPFIVEKFCIKYLKGESFMFS
ncbi:phosphotransferase [Bacillus sp. FSL K6-3431]|uniref:phosphotransferase n=1 Tax=Bacillus sp. FSL K6-3431 TaxID=2921500 RepID=UPI0030F931DE